MSKREFRYIPAKELRVARTEDGKRTLSGYAAVFNSLSEDLGGWREQLMLGAFSKCLANNPDICCLRDHNPTMIMGRTTAGTLVVSQDEVGLRFECELPDTTQANDLVTSIERGDVRGCSFGMFCRDEEWHDDNGLMVRDVIEADCFDVSCVTYPAYPATSVNLRSLFPDGNVEPPAKATRSTACDCECSECKDGNCADCSCPDCDCNGCECDEYRNTKLRLEIAKRV